MKKYLLLAVAALLAGGTIASAANQAGQVSISPVLGGYTFDGRQHLDTNPVYGLRVGYNFFDSFGIEGLVDFVNTEPTLRNGNVNTYRYGGELLYHFFPDGMIVPYIAAGYSWGDAIYSQVTTVRDHRLFDYGIGAKLFLSDNFALRGDVRQILYPVLEPGTTFSNIEYTMGVYIAFGGTAPVAKPVEPPPAPAPVPVPVPVPAPVVEPPPAPPAAPIAELTATPTAVIKGQPSMLNWKSQNASKCTIQPDIGLVETQGEKVVMPDTETSYVLECSGAGGTVMSTAAVVVKAPPEPPPVPVTPVVSVAAERFCSKPAVIDIRFNNGKSDIKAEYDAELKTIGDFLKEFPKAKGEISGHTDNVGGKAFNDRLSQKRAESVKNYIVKMFGISPKRITAKGYGFSKPVASNKTKEGKAKNRRIVANFTCE